MSSVKAFLSHIVVHSDYTIANLPADSYASFSRHGCIMNVSHILVLLQLQLYVVIALTKTLPFMQILVYEILFPTYVV